MSGCCVSGCKNRHSSDSKLKFYRIPSGYRPFQANRRRLWLQAITRVNGNTAGLRGNARVCGAHFRSGEASMDYDSPDFVPSVFTCAKLRRSSRKWNDGRRNGLRRTASAAENKRTSSRGDDSEEETETPPSPSVPKEAETLTKELETETETIKSQTCSPHKASASFRVPAGIPALDKMSPVVLLKSVYTPACGYQCELCNQNFTDASSLVQHMRLHENKQFLICEICGKLFTNQTDFTEHQHVHEPSFPCNMCDRSFTTSHHLKRHKLLHVRDGRKCNKCGVLFCQRHNHVLFLPQTEFEEDSSVTESQLSDGTLTPVNSLLEESELNQTANPDNDAQSTVTATPLQTAAAQAALPAPSNPRPLTKTRNPLPPASHTRVISQFSLPLLLKSSSVPRRPRYSRYNDPAPCVEPRQHPELPPSLKMFSPQYLTSAFLSVTRNYDYILSKTRDGRTKKDVKEEPTELPLFTPGEQRVEHIKKEETAYDLEVVL